MLQICSAHSILISESEAKRPLNSSVTGKPKLVETYLLLSVHACMDNAVLSTHRQASSVLPECLLTAAVADDS